jgi:hypothetical protein
MRQVPLALGLFAVLSLFTVGADLMAKDAPAPKPAPAPIAVPDTTRADLDRALSNVQTAQVQLGAAQAQYAATYYKALADAGLKSSEWQLSADRTQFVHVEPTPPK